MAKISDEMEAEVLTTSIEGYKKQLAQVNTGIETANDGPDKHQLVSLQKYLEQLIELSTETLNKLKKNSAKTTSEYGQLDEEYAMFMAEMEKEGALETADKGATETIEEDLKSLEGMKCRAPFRHSWGDQVYHNAMVCGAIKPDEENASSFEDILVRVMFTNPTHQEMLPCPYFLGSDCKFSEEQCRFSHGEVVKFSELQEYVEPDFTAVKNGCKVLAKQTSGLWLRAAVRRVFGDRCVVRFESNRKDVEADMTDVFPLENARSDNSDSSDECSSDGSVCRVDEIDDDRTVDVVKLLDPKANGKLGEWERYTRGIGSKLMQRMGYVVGTGLGRRAEGRVEPVSAVILPSGKSLDHCMDLREKAGGDKNLFCVEKRLKRMQKRQDMKNKKIYEHMKKKESENVFGFLNETLRKPKNVSEPGTSKSKHRQEIKAETNRDLNVASLKVDEEMKRLEKDLTQIRKSLSNHRDSNSQMNKFLTGKLRGKEHELVILQNKAINIKNEQGIRKDKKKLTLF